LKKKYEYDEYPQYYFKDIPTNLGDKLPKFTKIPYVIPINSSNDIVEVFNVNAEGFQAHTGVGFGNIQMAKVYFNIMIIENK
tara:strand:- start:4195 stop:4440 length:246 start_codon:yes stop_codon:yes gene_type:complete